MSNKDQSSVITANNECVEQWVRPEIKQLSAYHVPNPGKLVKLDAMENPYRWPEPLIEEWLQIIKSADINRYPDPGASALKQVLREKWPYPRAWMSCWVMARTS